MKKKKKSNMPVILIGIVGIICIIIMVVTIFINPTKKKETKEPATTQTTTEHPYAEYGIYKDFEGEELEYKDIILDAMDYLVIKYGAYTCTYDSFQKVNENIQIINAKNQNNEKIVVTRTKIGGSFVFTDEIEKESATQED